VVAETDISISRSSCRSRRLRVDLPAPDGEATTSMTPLRLKPAVGDMSLDILHLLPELLDQPLEIEPELGQRHVIGFGA
jgi:hypothetical protein